jgi:hypothetical protein
MRAVCPLAARRGRSAAAAQALFARALRPMQAPLGVKHLGQPVGQAVDHRAGAAAAGMVISPRIRGSTVPPLCQAFPHRRRPRLRCGPCASGGQAGGTLGGGRPSPLPPLWRQRQSLAAAVAELHEAVPAAQEHRQRRQQPGPGIWGRFPAVGVDGLGSVWRIDLGGLSPRTCPRRQSEARRRPTRSRRSPAPSPRPS